MDENILTNESREEDDRVVRTPDNIKNMNINSINQINSANFNKKMKGSGKVSAARASNP